MHGNKMENLDNIRVEARLNGWNEYKYLERYSMVCFKRSVDGRTLGKRISDIFSGRKHTPASATLIVYYSSNTCRLIVQDGILTTDRLFKGCTDYWIRTILENPSGVSNGELNLNNINLDDK